MYSEQQKRFFTLMNRFGKQKFRFRLRQVSQGEFMMLGAIWHETMGKQELEDPIQERLRKECQMQGVPVSGLTRHLGGSKSATSKMLHGLEEKGYIERILSKRDKRQIYITLTEQGKEMLKRVQGKMDESAKRVIERFGEEDTEQLLMLLEKFLVIVEEEIEVIVDNAERNDDIV